MSMNQLSECNDTYEIVGNQNLNREIAARPDLYEITDKALSHNDLIKVESNCCYASANEVTIQNLNASLPLKKKRSVYNTGKITSLENCKKFQFQIKHVLLSWLIAIIIVVSLIISTAVGFARLSQLKSAQQPDTLQFDILRNSNFSQNTQSTVISTATADVTTPPPLQLLPNHLQDTIISHNYLLEVFLGCVSREEYSLKHCVDVTLTTYGNCKFQPALSCQELYNILPNSSAKSGYYWVTASDGSIVQVYCDMTVTCGNITGGLTRIVSLNSENRALYCVGNISFNNIDGCFRKSALAGCSRIIFPTKNISYNYICGIVEGRYFGTAEGFQYTNRSSTATLNDNYVDGISLTYTNTSHRTHIWTFSATAQNCSINAPQFVGVHYSCLNTTYYCREYSCTTVFERNYLHTPIQDIELRFCQDQHRDEDAEGILLTDMELYVY